MAITERDVVEIYERHGLSRNMAIDDYETWASLLAPGMPDEVAKGAIDLLARKRAIAAAQRGGVPGSEAPSRKKRGVFSRLFGK